MSKILLLLAALSLFSAAGAQNRPGDSQRGSQKTKKHAERMSGDYDPTVLGLGRRSAGLSQSVIDRTVLNYYRTHVPGFRQSHMPNFIIVSPNGKTSLGIGGYVNFRTSYEFNGIVEDLDFKTWDIPVPRSYDSRQKLTMDASTTRLFFKAMADTRALGLVTAYVETDFRGYHDYNLRLRLAYITFKGLLFGQNVTTFCDLNASPTTVDFEGPNAYNLNFNTMIRYTYTSRDGRFQTAVAAEMPELSATFGERFGSVPQRMPDFPLYVQYNWGSKRDSHLRASAVFRDLYYYNMERGATLSSFGWGVQLSGNVKIARRWNTFLQMVYGSGITPYIQDITGSGLDLVPNPAGSCRMQTLPMLGWFAAGRYALSRRAAVSGGYSQVRVNRRHGYGPAEQYHVAQYVFGNIFWNISPHMEVAVEYLYGTRKNMDGRQGCANRVQAMIQYNF
ncbi:MAG: porin [Rikenellaceae bacterium]|nr:porin [Rikenellaceae bacterium]